MCGVAKNERMMLIRVFGIAARGTALIAVNGKGNYYDPPVQVSFSLSTPLQYLDSVVTKLLATLQGVTLDLAAPEERATVVQLKAAVNLSNSTFAD